MCVIRYVSLGMYYEEPVIIFCDKAFAIILSVEDAYIGY